LARLIPACTRAAVLAVPLLAGPSAAVVRVPAPGLIASWPAAGLISSSVAPGSIGSYSNGLGVIRADFPPAAAPGYSGAYASPGDLPVGGFPTLAFAPGRQDVPEPAGALVLAISLTGLAWCLARQNGDLNTAHTVPGRATSTMETTHA